MIRRHRLKTCFLVLMIIIALPVVRGQAAPVDDPGGPFRVKIELAPGFQGARPPRAPLVGIPDLPAGRDADSLLRFDPGAGREDIPGEGRAQSRPAGGVLSGGYFRLTFSRSLEEQRGRDILRFGKEGDDPLVRIRSLPSLLGAPVARDTFGTIGDIFSPQFNLEINF
jgi:hypothetical protein